MVLSVILPVKFLTCVGVSVCAGEQRSDRHQTVSAGAQRQEQGQMEFRDSDHEEVNVSCFSL